MSSSANAGGGSGSGPNTQTEKGSFAYSSTESKCLDFFTSGLLRDTEMKDTVAMLEAAWAENPTLALKILMHARDCRGGKGERKCVLSGLGWLRKTKPKTYKANLRGFIDVGCYRDLLDICASVDPKELGGGSKEAIELELLAEQIRSDLKALEAQTPSKQEASKMDVAEDEGKEKKTKPQKKKSLSISLAAKWAPSNKSLKYDNSKKGIKLGKRMAELMYPDSQAPRKLYRKTLSKLRSHLRIVEKDMSAKDFKKIDYAAVPSRAHNKYKNAFQKRDGERYAQFKNDVKTGKKTIKARGMHPHELVNHFLRGGFQSQAPQGQWACPSCTFHNGAANSNCEVCGARKPDTIADTGDETVELQWAALVESVQKEGLLQNCVAVSDVSGSMDGVPMQVSIALGILVAQCSAEPFKGRLISFHENPSWHKVPVATKSLKAMVENVKRMEWGGTTRMDKVFDLLLNVALEHKLPQEALPEKLFVFTDMQFDEANGSGEYKTVFEQVKEKYERAGYRLPGVIFWNLRASKKAFPVNKDAPGVALVSGFSPDLIKTVMKGEFLTPMAILLKAVDKYEVKVDSSEASTKSK